MSNRNYIDDMTCLTKRSKKTNLSNEELYLFDALFDSNIIVSALAGEVNDLGLSCSNHKLSSNQLVNIVNKFIGKDLMRLKLISLTKINKIYTTAGLTPMGGKLWEDERDPIWENFIIDNSSNEKGFWELTVLSPSLDTAKTFLKISNCCNLYKLKYPDNLSYDQVCSKKEHIPWKDFPNLFRICAELAKPIDKGRTRIDWKLYQNHLKWWRTVSELELLKKKTRGG